MLKTWQEISEKLQEPFHSDEIEWRPQSAFRNKQGSINLMVLPYLQGHAIQDRLDKVLGSNWSDEYESIVVDGKEAFRAKLSIKVEDEWITRSDAAEISDFESVKGGHTNAFKRVAVKWGIGRYLYKCEPVFVPLLEKGDIRIAGKFKINGKDEYVKGYIQRPLMNGTDVKVNQVPNTQQIQPSGKSQNQEIDDVRMSILNWIKTAEKVLDMPKEYIVGVFNKANKVKVNSLEQVYNADVKKLRQYCHALRPVRVIALLPHKYTNCSLEEILTFVQTLKPEIKIGDIYSLFFKLTDQDVKSVVELTKTTDEQRTQTA